MKVRSIVTGQAEGKAVIVSDGTAPRSHDFLHWPGMSTSLVWSTEDRPVVPSDGSDPIDEKTTWIPPLGESRLMVVAIPPDSLAVSPEFDGAAAGGIDLDIFEHEVFSLEQVNEALAIFENRNGGFSNYVICP